MSKRYTFEEDYFIVAYYDGIGAYIGPHDLGRSEASVTARAAKLKKDGGWDCLQRMMKARQEYHYLMHKEVHGYTDNPFDEVDPNVYHDH